MEKVKAVTRSLSLAIGLFVFLAIAFTLAQVGKQLGMWVKIDEYYHTDEAKFFLLVAITRGMFNVISLGLTLLVCWAGHRRHWLYGEIFESSYWHVVNKNDRNSDWSILFLLVLFLVFVSFYAGDFLIRLFTMMDYPG